MPSSSKLTEVWAHNAVSHSKCDTPIPNEIGKYRVIDVLGQGGQGVVYRAIHPTLGRDVVIKYCLQRHAISEEARHALASEGRVLASLDHPNLAKVYDLDFHGEDPFLVMEFIRGLNLSQYWRQHQPTTAESVSIVRKICEAIHYVHSCGVSHFDLKPQNVLIREDGVPFLIDFGLSRVETAWSSFGLSPDQISGTLQYMAPEQANGDSDAKGPRTDVYGLGGILFFVLTGKPPISGNTSDILLRRAQRGEWDRETLGAVHDVELRTIVTQALAFQPTERLVDAAQLSQALADWQSQQNGSHQSSHAVETTTHRQFPVRSWGSTWLYAAGGFAIIALALLWFRPQWTKSNLPLSSSTAPLELSARVWKDRTTFDLVDAVPVYSGNRLELRSHIPANAHASLFLFDSAGRLQCVESRLPQATAYAYRYPSEEENFEELVGPSGIEFVFLCVDEDGPVTLLDLRDSSVFHEPWGALAEDTVISVSDTSVEYLQKGRGFGGSVPTLDPQQQVLERLKQLKTDLSRKGISVCGIAFAHAE